MFAALRQRRRRRDVGRVSQHHQHVETERQVGVELLRRLLPVRGSGIGYLQGIPAGLDTIKNQKNNRGNTTWANVSRRVYTVGRPKLTTNKKLLTLQTHFSLQSLSRRVYTVGRPKLTTNSAENPSCIPPIPFVKHMERNYGIR